MYSENIGAGKLMMSYIFKDGRTNMHDEVQTASCTMLDKKIVLLHDNIHPQKANQTNNNFIAAVIYLVLKETPWRSLL